MGGIREDWAKTSLVMEASMSNLESSKGKDVMCPFTTLREKYGKKNTEGIRSRKYELEKKRDYRTDPKPFYMDHPETDDKEP